MYAFVSQLQHFLLSSRKYGENVIAWALYRVVPVLNRMMKIHRQTWQYITWCLTKTEI